MNFLMLRPSQTATPAPASIQEFQAETNYVSKAAATLEGLITQDPFQMSTSAEDNDEGSDGFGRDNGDVTGSNDKNNPPIVENHIDVSEDEGWITIPYKELPDNWIEAADILLFRSLDRRFLFPGEQVHILACLSASKQDTEILTPFKVAAAMNKNGIGHLTMKQNGNIGYNSSLISRRVEVGPDGHDIDQHGDDPLKGKLDQQKDVSAGESLLKLEVHKRQTETLLRSITKSHFFVRIAESDEPLWSKRRAPVASPESSETRKTAKKKHPLNGAVDKGSFDAGASGGMARNPVKCCSLSNGDIVAGRASSSLHLPSNIDRNTSSADQYAVLVSCRCNYTESRLFFKQPTSWRPCISRDLLISVASEMSRQSLGSSGIVSQLPVQVLTLQASNLTSEDLTLTVFAPASFTSPPSVVSLNSSPSSPLSPFDDSYDRHGIAVQRLNPVPIEPENERHSGDGGPRSISFSEQVISISDVLPRNDLGCTHLWLQSRVPLGCVPPRSTATIKLELLPLTDGIITLDSLQIDVKEKGLSYVPEHSLKINATSSIATGII